MLRALLLAVLLSAPIFALAKKVHYWVLGSYANADNAHSEMERLSTELDRTIEIRFDEKLAVFRVLTPASEVNREALGGQDAWLLPIEVDDSSVQPAAFSEPAMRQTEAPIVFEEPPSEPLFPEFADRETLHEYCERLPEARLCQHPRIAEAVKTDRKLSEARDKLKGVCSEITHPDWLATCRSLHPELDETPVAP